MRLKGILDVIIISLLLTNLSCGLGYSNKVDDPCVSDFVNEFSFCTPEAGGEIDTSFGTNGSFSQNELIGSDGDDPAYAVDVQSDGMIVVGGSAYNGTNKDLVLIRLTTSGALDTSFGTDGIVTGEQYAGGDSDDIIQDLTIQSDGKIVATGYSHNGANYDMVTWRFNTDGSLDTDFGNCGDGGADGYCVHNNAAGGNAHDLGKSVVINSDGTIIVAGYSSDGGNYDLTVWKLKADGSLDADFGSSGVFVDDSSQTEKANAAAVLSDGRIVVVGENHNGSDYDIGVWLVKADGSALDTTFGTSGVYSFDQGANDYGYGVAVQSDNKIVAVGDAYDGTAFDMAIMRLTTAGALDTSFSDDGYDIQSHASAGNYKVIGRDVAIQDNGKIVVTGEYDTDSSGTDNLDMVVWRYVTAGDLDTNFSTDGIFTHDKASGGAASKSDSGQSVAVNAQGKIIVAGYSENSSDSNYEYFTVWQVD